MKNALTLFLLLPAFAFAQDCKLRKTVDPFNHETKLSTGFQDFSGNGLNVAISADASSKEIDFFIWIKGDGKCFDAESIANIVFEGERSRTNLRNSGSMNCEGAFHFIFKNIPTTPSWLNRLATKKIATIKLTGAGAKEYLITLSEEQKTLLQSMAVCMTTEGKTLIPQQ